MRLRLVTGPEGGVTLDEAKTHLRVTGISEDALIERMILAATARVELEAGRAFGEQTWEAVLDAFPDEDIDLGFGPLVSITSVKYLDGDGVEQTMDAGAYEFVSASPDGVIVPLVDWPAASEVSNAVVVRFVAGDGFPEDIRQAILLLLAHWYENRETATDRPMAEMPYAATALVGLRRRMFV